MYEKRFSGVRTLLFPLILSVLAACGGGGGDDDDDGGPQPPPTPPPTSGNVTVSGRITFDRVPVGPTGLNFALTQEAPAREVVVEAINATSNAVIATTSTDAAGNYSLSVPANTSMFVRARAQMVKSGTAPTYNFEVLNNTNGNALFVLDGQIFDSASGATRNLRATSGWGGTSYTGTRAAAPFAILDTVYRAKELLVAAQSSLQMPELDLFWSPTNRTSEALCPSTADIGTTSYIAFGDQQDECGNPGRDGIYVLGFTDDTDEFDQHVIAHEFGHYVEDKFARADSIGGPHGSGDRLDPRVAFGEGWGNSFSAMVINDPQYRDSTGLAGAGGFNLDNNNLDIEGWYSEASVGQILWDIFDAGTESGDTVNLNFGPVYNALVSQRDTDALTTIYSFTQSLRSQNAAAASSISSLETSEQITGRGDFVDSPAETNAGGDVLPLYDTVAVGTPKSVCSRANFGRYNKLGNRRFLRLTLPQARTVVINLQAAVDPATSGSQPAEDPDLFLWRRGELVGIAQGTGATDTTGARNLSAGVYIVEVFDYAYGGEPGNDTTTTPSCMTVSVIGQ